MSVRLFPLFMLACSSPEDEAGDVALRFVTADVGTTFTEEVGKRLVDLACADEREAGSELMATLLSTRTDGASVVTVTDTKPLAITVSQVVLDADRRVGDVTLTWPHPKEDGTGKLVNKTLKVRKDEAGWCVMTGWAEDKRVRLLEEEIKKLDGDASTRMKSWDFEGARTALSSAEERVSLLPEDRRASSTASLALTRALLDARSKGWVGGRWIVTSEKDAMTDQMNTVARLESVNGIPNSIGREEPAHLIVRCDRGKLDVYVTTDAILDSDWRYDSVSGQHRFGTAAPARFSGNVSTSRQAVFLRQPSSWLKDFRAHEAEPWTVELPVYNRKPASVKFDLTAIGKALDSISDSCK